MSSQYLAAWRIALAMLSIAPVATAAFANNASPAPAAAEADAVLSEENVSMFLGRLMQAESAGKDFAANPRSTALGAFQFIRSTFLDVARRHFTEEVDELTEKQVLALRTNREFSRRAALAYTTENAAYLTERGVEPTLAHLRLAYLLGPAGAVRLVQAPADQPVSRVFDRAVVRANPFMRRMTATDLIAKAEREMGERASAPAPERRLASTVPTLRCRRQLASCRKAMALEQRRLKARQEAREEEARQEGTPAS